MVCKICYKEKATLPDRNKPWSKRKEICSKCHQDRLKSDLKVIIKDNIKRSVKES